MTGTVGLVMPTLYAVLLMLTPLTVTVNVAPVGADGVTVSADLPGIVEKISAAASCS